jgi:hypothetical protein
MRQKELTRHRSGKRHIAGVQVHLIGHRTKQIIIQKNIARLE